MIPQSPLSAKGVGVSPVLKIGPDREADVSLSFRQRDGLGPPGGSSGEEPGWQCGRRKRRGLDPWVGKTPWRRKWQPTPVFLPAKSHGQRNLEGYSSWSRKESDTTERLPLNKEIATHSSILTQKIPETEEPTVYGAAVHGVTNSCTQLRD